MTMQGKMPVYTGKTYRIKLFLTPVPERGSVSFSLG